MSPALEPWAILGGKEIYYIRIYIHRYKIIIARLGGDKKMLHIANSVSKYLRNVPRFLLRLHININLYVWPFHTYITLATETGYPYQQEMGRKAYNYSAIQVMHNSILHSRSTPSSH